MVLVDVSMVYVNPKWSGSSVQGLSPWEMFLPARVCLSNLRFLEESGGGGLKFNKKYRRWHHDIGVNLHKLFLTDQFVPRDVRKIVQNHDYFLLWLTDKSPWNQSAWWLCKSAPMGCLWCCTDKRCVLNVCFSGHSCGCTISSKCGKVYQLPAFDLWDRDGRRSHWAQDHAGAGIHSLMYVMAHIRHTVWLPIPERTFLVYLNRVLQSPQGVLSDLENSPCSLHSPVAGLKEIESTVTTTHQHLQNSDCSRDCNTGTTCVCIKRGFWNSNYKQPEGPIARKQPWTHKPTFASQQSCMSCFSLLVYLNRSQVVDPPWRFMVYVWLQVEELIEQAEDELNLIPLMAGAWASPYSFVGLLTTTGPNWILG